MVAAQVWRTVQRTDERGQVSWGVWCSLSVTRARWLIVGAWNVPWNESHEYCVRLVLSVHTSAASVQAERPGAAASPS